MTLSSLDGLTLVLRCKLKPDARAACVAALEARGARVVRRVSSRVDGVFVDDVAGYARAASAGAQVLSAAQLGALVGGAAWAHLTALEGARLVLVGGFAPEGQAALGLALQGRGARVASGVSSQTSALIVGALPGGQAEGNASVCRARERGVPVLGVEALASLLGGATLAQVLAARSEAVPAAPTPPNAALAALRALAYQEPSAAAWAAICAELDGLDPDALEVALDYIEGATASWPARLHEACLEQLYPECTLAEGDELRALPEAWLAGVLAGQDHPKLRAARVVVGASKKLTNALGVGLLRCRALARVRGLYLANNKLSKTFCAQLARSPDPLPGLELLDLTQNPLRNSGLRALVRAPAWGHLRAVSLRCAELTNGAGAHFADLRAPRLRKLMLDENALGEEAMGGLAQAALPSLEVLGLRSNIVLDDAACALVGGSWPNLRVLDLRANRLEMRGLLALMRAASMPQLETLRLDTFITAPIDAEEDAIVAPSKRLRTLELPVAGLGDVGLQRLLAHCAPETMRHLSVTYTLPSAHVAAGLVARFPALASLDLSKGTLDGAFVDALAMCGASAGLKVLDLDHNRLGAQDVMRLLRLPVMRDLETLRVSYNAFEEPGALLRFLAAEGPKLSALRVISMHTDAPVEDVVGVRRLLDAEGVDHIERVEMYWEPELWSEALNRRFTARFCC